VATAIDRSERIGLGISIAAHVAVIAVLSVGLLDAPKPEQPKLIPIDVSLAEDVGFESTAPVVSHEELAAKKSPVEAPVEPDSVPPEPAPEPEPVPEPKPRAAPPKPAPAPAEKPQPQKPEPRPAKPSPPQKPTAAPARTASTSPSRRPVKPTGNLAGLDLGRSNNRTDSTALNNPASKASAAEVASFRGVIQRQIQPCANRQVTPGPGAERIRILVRLNFNPDGSLAGEPQITGVQGNDAANGRYVERVKDLARATFKGCSPIRGLPAELYAVPNGWKSLPFSYGLPG
jgi:outer membrane biosynthesis protein TonB